VLRDLLTALKGFAPADAKYRHNSEGPDDMPAHIKTMLTNVTLHVPVIDDELALGIWQAIYVIEHRARPHRRDIVLQAFT
jgi:secondary thiamine-phosphate synthase enzyme